MNKKSLLLSFVCLFISIYSFSQINLISFRESHFVYFDSWPCDDNGNPLSIIKVEVSDLSDESYLNIEELQLFTFSSENHTCITIEYQNGNDFYPKDGIWVCVALKADDQITISHPSYGSINVSLPSRSDGHLRDYLCEEYKMVLSCQRNSNSNSHENSYNVIVYDKNGQQYMTGLFIRSAGKSYIRLQKGRNGYDQYTLKESDKKEYKYMTTGESKIEPLYVK